MKLITEDKLAEFYVESNGYTDMANRIDEYVKKRVIDLLPTDKEISEDLTGSNDWIFIGGAKWMRDEIIRRLG